MNRILIQAAAVTLAIASGSSAANAEPAPLNAAALAQCANHALTLRSESARINQQSAQLDQRRAAINQRSVSLNAESAQRDASNLEAGLDLHSRQKAHNSEAVAFNHEVAQIRRDIVAINQTRDSYDQQCSQRSYRRRDLEALPPAMQQAMRAGLDDVDVPYLDPRLIAPLQLR